MRALVACLLLLLLTACEESRAHRTWRPSDHAQPEGVSTGRTAPATPTAASPEDARLAAAASLYRTRCAGCHGATGHGDGPDRAPVMQLPDFGSVEFQSGRSDEALAASIAEGRNMMPGFGDQIAPEGIAALVAHVRTLGAR